MDIKKELIQLVKDYTEDGIDITENYEEWKKFLTEQGYIKTYDEVYEMDLNYLISNKDSDYWDEENQKWNVELLIENDNDITNLPNGYFFVHNQQYINEYDIELFYEQQENKIKQQRLNWAMNQAYMDLKSSTNGFSRFDALLFIFGHDFGEQEIFFASDMAKVRKELLKCIKDVLEVINDAIYDGSVKLWLPNHDMWSDEEDEHYCELIRFGGYGVLEDGQKILDADAIILKDEEGNQTLDYYTYQNMHHLCDYIADLFEYYKEDYNNICDEDYTEEINQKLNNIINSYWQNTIEFDYAEMEMI